MTTRKPLLIIQNLSVRFRKNHEVIDALSEFSCSLYPGECTAVIGESGCGKSVAAHAILRLFPAGTEISGSVQLDSLELLTIPDSILEKIRGKRIGIIYQNPDRSLNPVYRIERQMNEPLDTHLMYPAPGRRDHVTKTLRQAGFSDPDQARLRYPCHNSGGMNQRAATAVILGLLPDIIIADEPTKGLDSNRLHDMEKCLREMKDNGHSLLLITHDIALAQRVADELIVMYAGQIIEKGPVNGVLSAPLHPYTIGLINSLPQNGFIPINGYAPPLSRLPAGCRFAERCSRVSHCCLNQSPGLKEKNRQVVRCHQC